MATLKATVKSKRKDGMYVVYIRFAHNRKVSYLRASWMGLRQNQKSPRFRALVLLGINCGGEGILTADSHILL